VGRSLGAKISGGRGHPWKIFFGFYKTRHILLSNGANCTVLRAVVLTQYLRVTDRQTDGRTAVACTCIESFQNICRNNATMITCLSFHQQLTDCLLAKPMDGHIIRLFSTTAPNTCHSTVIHMHSGTKKLITKSSQDNYCCTNYGRPI